MILKDSKLKIGVVDSNHMLHRMMHIPAFQDMYYREDALTGILIGPTFGYLKSLRNVLDKFNFDILLVIWDGGHSDRRNALLPTYKDKGEITEDYKEYKKIWYQQKEYINKILPLFGVRVLQLDKEADDTIGFITKNLNLHSKFTIISEDTDYYQLIDKDIDLYRPIREEFYDLETLIKVSKLTPAKQLWFKAICGDGSDNISGIPGVGGGTAAKVAELIEFTPEGGINNPDFKSLMEDYFPKICEPSMDFRVKKVLENLDIVFLNYELVDISLETFDINQISSMQWSLSKLNFYFKESQSKMNVLKYLTEWEMNSIIMHYDVWSLPFWRLQ